MATLLETRHVNRRADRGASRVVPRVGVDATQIVFGVSGGVEVYFKTLVRALMTRAAGATPILIAREDQAAHLESLFPGVAKRLLPAVRHPFVVRATRWVGRRLAGRTPPKSPPPPSIPFARLERELALDLLHSPVQLFADCEFEVPGVLNLHDLQHLHYPENFTPEELELRNRLYGGSARCAAMVIASSDFVRRDIVKHLGLPSGQVQVIPVACDPEVLAGGERFGVEAARNHYCLPETFAFYPAAFWPHKNHVRLLEALAIVRSREPKHDLKLVCSGCREHSGWAETERALDRTGLREHVRFLDFIPAEHLAGVYRASQFCVVPSLFEASSYPVIEAQSLGVAAMCSRITSLPELMADGAGLLFDPQSAESIAESMIRWLNDPQDRAEHALRGRERANREHSLISYATRVGETYASIIGRVTDV